jgi:hypothetical protein
MLMTLEQLGPRSRYFMSRVGSPLNKNLDFRGFEVVYAKNARRFNTEGSYSMPNHQHEHKSSRRHR